MTGFGSYLILIMVGVDFAAFWGFLIFLLNYIPTIGSLLGVVFPSVLALVQFGTYTEPLIVLGACSAIQMTIGNFIEPRAMGSTLNVSPLVVILSLVVWGTIWGVVGMFLSVPITVALIIIFASFPATRPIAIILSRDGQVDVPANAGGEASAEA